MALMQIYYLIDPAGLSNGGTFGKPNPYGGGHPPIKYGYRGQALHDGGGDTPVPVMQGDSVNIYAIQAGSAPDPRLEMAPVRLIAMKWTPTGRPQQDANAALMTGDQPPIGRLTFAVHDIHAYRIDYVRDTFNDWTNNDSAFSPWANGGSNSGEDARVDRPSMTRPYITFEVGQEVTGVLQYGLELHSWREGNSQGSVWWDPKLQINPYS
ncbi:hypothetical protein PPSIR1_00220 [Plesiocystis pacifica SIR-1]|uniref:Uncharacterized protein n=2 Tax=Plesiocystis pacifica TaxID=191768 RepID=A6GEV9_9BACT|nr:hypothetical protein PPSIR1_00220 [Plesiocystis pacifica SIR-1]